MAWVSEGSRTKREVKASCERKMIPLPYLLKTDPLGEMESSIYLPPPTRINVPAHRLPLLHGEPAVVSENIQEKSGLQHNPEHWAVEYLA